jgi:hypothetical protein
MKIETSYSFEQSDDLPFRVGSWTCIPDLTRWLGCFVAILLDPVRGGIVGAKRSNREQILWLVHVVSIQSLQGVESRGKMKSIRNRAVRWRSDVLSFMVSDIRGRNLHT